jgi:rhodanese-related sulfurtransferase
MKCTLIPRLGLTAGLATLGLLFGFSSCPAQDAAATSGPGSAFSITQVQLIQPETLHHLLQAGGANKTLVLQVGSRVLYAEAHIPGADYAGPGSQPIGLQALRSRVATLSRRQFIVLYCGCCPWNHCPNVGPAFHQLHDMGFTNVKVLYLADNFGADWVDRGYPVERGH